MADEEKDEELLTPAECAALHNIRRQAVNDAIKRGKLKARKVGRHYAITKKDCEGYTPMEARQESGKKGAARRWKPEEETPE